MKYELRHPYAICAVAFQRVAGAVQSASTASAAYAKTVTICAQTIDNIPRDQRETLPPERQALWGIWDGEVRVSSQVRLCVGWLFGGINEQGEPSAIYAYNSSSSGVLNNAKMGSAPWRDGRFQNGTLVMKGSQASFELRKVNDDTLEGSYMEGGHSYPVTFKRRKASS